MPLKEAQRLPEAAADAIEALAHLAMFAAAEGHADFAATALGCLEALAESPDAGKVVPAEYFTALTGTADDDTP